MCTCKRFHLLIYYLFARRQQNTCLNVYTDNKNGNHTASKVHVRHYYFFSIDISAVTFG